MNTHNNISIPFEEISLSDQEIVDLFFSRDEAALAETQNHYGTRLSRLAFSFLQNHEDAEECVNDVWLKAWNSIPPQHPEDLFSYLARLCRFTAFDMIDKREALKRRAVVTELSEELQETIPDTHADMPFEESDLSEHLNAFLGSLSEEKRHIFVKRYWYEESIAEVAHDMNRSLSYVKVTLHRLRKALKAYLLEKGVFKHERI